MIPVILFVVAGRASAADPVEVRQGLLAAVGDTLSSTVVTGILRHPEYERYTMRSGDGAAMVAELTLYDGVHQGVCEAGGLVIFPRPELVEGALAPVDLMPWCAALPAAASSGLLGRSGVVLAAAPPEVALPGPVVGDASAPWVSVPDAVLVPALRTCGWVAVGVGAWLLRGRALGLLLAAAVALVLRRLAIAPGLFNGAGASFEKLLLALGERGGGPYGPGFAVAMEPGVAILGATPAAVFSTNLGYACATVGLGYALVARETRSRLAGWSAALALALSPPALVLSRSEAMHVSGVFFAVLAVFLAAHSRAERGRTRWAAALGAAAAATSAAWIRPDLALAFPVAAAFALGTPTSWPAVVGLAGAGAARVATVHQGGHELLRVERYFSLDTWLHGLSPRFGQTDPGGGFALFADAGYTSPAWWVLAALGLWSSRGRPVALRALAWTLVATLPFVPKSWPLADALRLQLFGFTGLCVLVGLGAARLGRWGPLVVVVPLLGGLGRMQPRWATHQEWAFLAETVPALGDGTVVVAPAYGHRNEAFRGVMERLGPARWVEAGEGTLYYRSIGEAAPGGTPFATLDYVAEGDLDVAAAGTVGFYQPVR